ncbi:MAG: dephospho-CoA kinase [Lachnospiraceae bacterium]|nr:dephospho-CoA kinase [Lachnospiraceae bacterium]
MKFIGITGGIGAGKSLIIRYIESHYRAKVYLADDVAKQLQEPGSPAFPKLVEALGSDVLQPDGWIDKRKMADRIYADPALRQKVNEILHPAVRIFLTEALEAERAEGITELFFVEAALLIEAGYVGVLDELWYVYAPEEVRIRRLMESRGYSEEKARSIMASQLPDAEFRKYSDFVIDNGGSPEEAFARIREKLEAYTWLE